MLEREFEYYRTNQDKLVNLYNGKTIVIRGEQVVGVYNTSSEAYLESVKLYEPGTFMIQLCGPGVENYSVTFHSRVHFA